MSADPADWVTDGYGCLRMIRILADAYGFLSVSIRSYRKWPCDCTMRVMMSVLYKKNLAAQTQKSAVSCENMTSVTCRKRRPRSACASVQSDQGLCFPESLDIIEF